MQRGVMREHSCFLIVLVSAVLIPWGGPASASAGTEPPSGMALRRTPVVRVFEETRDAVVNIACIRIVEQESWMDDLFNPFFDRRFRPGPLLPQQEIIGVGSGFTSPPCPRNWRGPWNSSEGLW